MKLNRGSPVRAIRASHAADYAHHEHTGDRALGTATTIGWAPGASPRALIPPTWRESRRCRHRSRIGRGRHVELTRHHLRRGFSLRAAVQRAVVADRRAFPRRRVFAATTPSPACVTPRSSWDTARRRVLMIALPRHGRPGDTRRAARLIVGLFCGCRLPLPPPSPSS